jgi:hypothetical protein
LRLRLHVAAVTLGSRPEESGDDSVDLTALDHAYGAFEDAIASPALKEVARHWRAICGRSRLPSWNDIRPSAIKAQLTIVWCYDYDPALDDFVGRLAGQGITGVSTKPFKGTRLSELRPNDKYPRSLVRAKRVLQEPALYRGHGAVYKTADSRGFGERVVMPLKSEDSYPGGIFGATEFKSVTDWLKSSSNIEAEDEKWFSLAGLVRSPSPEGVS